MLVIAFIGADGTGKSTLVEALTENLDQPVKNLYLGQKQFVLPLIGRWATSEGRLRSAIFHWITFPIDLRLRTLGLLARKLLRREHQIVLIDRLPSFPFEGRSRTLKTIYKFALPRIDMLVLLAGDADIIYSRKPEGSKQNLLRNMEKVELLFKNFDTETLIRLDISRTVSEHIADMAGHIATKSGVVVGSK